MALTKDFRETIRERAQREPKFRKALLREAIELMLSGDDKIGRAILRNYINATVGFRQLQEATSIPANSLMRMFGPKGNPSAKNLFWSPRRPSAAGRSQFPGGATQDLTAMNGQSQAEYSLRQSIVPDVMAGGAADWAWCPFS